MKKQILVLLALTLTTSCFATLKNEQPGIISKETRLLDRIKKLVTKGSVDVVLFEDSSKILIIEGKPKNVAAVMITEEDGVLTISNNGTGGRAVIYLPVQHLEMIEAYGTSRISSCTTLESSLLTLVANDYCKIAVRSFGRIIIKETEDADLYVERVKHPPLKSTNS